MHRLQVHHMEFRSHSGADSEENLITLRCPVGGRIGLRRSTSYTGFAQCSRYAYRCNGWLVAFVYLVATPVILRDIAGYDCYNIRAMRRRLCAPL